MKPAPPRVTCPHGEGVPERGSTSGLAGLIRPVLATLRGREIDFERWGACQEAGRGAYPRRIGLVLPPRAPAPQRRAAPLLLQASRPHRDRGRRRRTVAASHQSALTLIVELVARSCSIARAGVL